MKRFVLEIQYNGSKYCGWQIQDNAVTVQGILQKAISLVIGEQCMLIASGRTDAGVHAIKQVAHFDSESAIPTDKMCYAINNAIRDEDIVITKSYEADATFNARKSIKRKTYLYRMYVSEMEDVFLRGRAERLRIMPSVELMNSGAKHLIGEHDFACFCASNSGAKTTVRNIYEARFEQCGNKIDFYISGNGFLYNMVRIIVGTMLDVGYGKMQPDKVAEIIDSCDRKNASKTAGACGLYLFDAQY